MEETSKDKIKNLSKGELMQLLYTDELDNNELQYVIETLNENSKIENEEFEAFQVLLLKDINITTNEV